MDRNHNSLKVIICPDSFKGSLTSVEAAEAIACGIVRATSPHPASEGGETGTPSHLGEGRGGVRVDIVKLPLADGGEGTVDALVRATGGEIRPARVHDPLMREVDSFYGILGGGVTACIEMAAASGLGMVEAGRRNPLVTTTYGTGELIRLAAESGAKKILIGIGGSATNDGGTGAMAALGARFLDAAGADLPPGGAALAMLDRIDMSEFSFPVGEVDVEVACDVTNPLCGPDGASAVFGPQKGATPEMVSRLDAALANYARVMEWDLGASVADMPGAGAAGGLGAALAAFLKARLRSGIDIVLDAARFDEHLRGADLVITGEGRIDRQTAFGKTIGGVLKRTSKAGVCTVALAGAVDGNIQALYDSGLTAAFSITPGPMALDEAIRRAGELLENAAMNVVRVFLRGHI